MHKIVLWILRYRTWVYMYKEGEMTRTPRHLFLNPVSHSFIQSENHPKRRVRLWMASLLTKSSWTLNANIAAADVSSCITPTPSSGPYQIHNSSCPLLLLVPRNSSEIHSLASRSVVRMHFSGNEFIPEWNVAIVLQYCLLLPGNMLCREKKEDSIVWLPKLSYHNEQSLWTMWVSVLKKGGHSIKITEFQRFGNWG